MKKVIFGFVVLTLMFSTSCKKTSTPSLSWSLYGITYNQATCGIDQGGNELVAVSTNSPSTVYVSFGAGVLPTGGGSYTVTSNPFSTAPNSIFFNFENATTGVTYFSTGGNGSNQKVTVSVSSGGKISLNASNVEMVNSNTGVDSTAMNINIAEQ